VSNTAIPPVCRAQAENLIDSAGIDAVIASYRDASSSKPPRHVQIEQCTTTTIFRSRCLCQGTHHDPVPESTGWFGKAGRRALSGMSTLIVILLFVLAIAVLVAVLKVVAGIVVLIIGALIGLYLWNRYLRAPVGHSSGPS
jgi:disulfide bond formation protein DsbB